LDSSCQAQKLQCALGILDTILLRYKTSTHAIALPHRTESHRNLNVAMHRTLARWVLTLVFSAGLVAGTLGVPAWAAPPADQSAELTVTPHSFALRGRGAQQRLLVTGVRDGRAVDRTREASYVSETPEVVRVDTAGV